MTTLYLRLNGLFTSGLVLHSEVWGQDIGDVDCLAVWHPFHDQSEREVAPDPFLEMGGRRELLLCEVKSSAAALSFNERLRTVGAPLRKYVNRRTRRPSSTASPPSNPQVVYFLSGVWSYLLSRIETIKPSEAGASRGSRQPALGRLIDALGF